ncbi:MAG: hypothetical protein ACRCVT_13305 [Leadbetterella sp.]
MSQIIKAFMLFILFLFAPATIHAQKKGFEKLINSKSIVLASLGVSFEFFLGKGPEARIFENNHALTKSLKEAFGTKKVILKWHKAYLDFQSQKRSEAPIYYRFDFPDWKRKPPFIDLGDSGPIREIIRDDRFTTIQLIGTAIYNFDFQPHTKTLYVCVEDTKSVFSLFLHLIPIRHSREKFKPMSVTTQTYKFEYNQEELLYLLNTN